MTLWHGISKASQINPKQIKFNTQLNSQLNLRQTDFMATKNSLLLCVTFVYVTLCPYAVGGVRDYFKTASTTELLTEPKSQEKCP